LLAAFQPCFHAPSYANFRLLVAGWVHCLGRRTVTAMVLAAGGVGDKHISAFHRFFSRAQWSLDAVGKVAVGLVLRWVGPDHPLIALGDDTLARKTGKCIGLASMHHDPLLSSARKPFFSFGHVWVVLAIWVPLPMGKARGFALPVLFRLYVGAKRGGRRDGAAHPTAGKRQQAADKAYAEHGRATKLALMREMVGALAAWAGDRTVYLAVDAAYAGRALLEGRPANVHLVGRPRMDAALWTAPPPRKPGQRGRPRKRGERLPNPKAMAAARRHWHGLPVTIYGQTVRTEAFRCAALWYAALRDQPLRIVVVRDPRGRRRVEAFFCTDLSVGAAFILETYARRWALEVCFHDAKQFLGFEDAQNQASAAAQRTAPLALVVYSLVLLWYADRAHDTAAGGWLRRPWYPKKTAPSFLDMLTALRREGWRTSFSQPSYAAWQPHNPDSPWTDTLLATA
jgi:hypothetical protein